MKNSQKETSVHEEEILSYHLMHPGGDSRPGDPNVAFYSEGTYHLHYILRHPWHGEISYSFIHVTSEDMLNWTWQKTKLQPSFTGHGMFSGTGFITKDGKPAAIYCATAVEPRNTFITLANDKKLSSWNKPYPLLPKGGPDGKDILLLGDPDCFQVGDTYYAYSAMSSSSNASVPSSTTSLENVQLCKSKDLVNWKYVGRLLKYDLPEISRGEDLSCANMFPIGNKWMILCISHSMGCRYYLGEWDDKSEQFVPETHGRMNWRRHGQSLLDPVYRDFFAPESLLTPDGRRVMWAWLASLDKNIDRNYSGIDLKTIQSLPRELSLASDGSLLIKPLRELEALRYEAVIFEKILVPLADNDTVASGKKIPYGKPHLHLKRFIKHITELRGDSFEIRIQIDRTEAERRRFGFLLFSNEDLEGLPVLIRPESGVISIGETEAPFSISVLPEAEDIEIRIFIDKYLIEVFINDRQALVTSFVEYKDSGFDFNAYAFAGQGDKPMQIKKIEIWKMKSTNKGFLEARDNQIWAPELQ